MPRHVGLKSQRQGDAIHSPQNCLLAPAGAGLESIWTFADP
jgi:hypothetical protein